MNINLFRFIISSIIDHEPDKDKIKEKVIETFPELKDDNITDYETVCTIRRWAANIISWSTYSLLFNVRDRYFDSLSAYEMYRLFNDSVGGVWCSGASLFLRKIYKIFGFEACVAGYGTPDAFTHTITLVKINDNGKELYSIQDAYFDITYESTNNNPMDYFRMLEYLKQKRDSEIAVVQSQPVINRKIYLYSGDACPDLKNSGNCEEITYSLPDGRNILKCDCTFDMEFALYSQLEKAYTFLHMNQLPQKLIYLYLFPISISDDFQGKMLRKARELTDWPVMENIGIQEVRSAR